jgi:hypothetical protein
MQLLFESELLPLLVELIVDLYLVSSCVANTDVEGKF